MLSEGGRSFLEMASEITYAEVKFKNESNSLHTYSESPAGKTKQKSLSVLNVDGRIKEMSFSKLGGICE